ncbi:MAG: nuclease-related domain-containing protein [Syntrophales bacterium]
MVFYCLISGIFLLVGSLLMFYKILENKLLEQDNKLLETVTKSNRGTESERDLVLKLLKYGIPAETIFHDLYLKRINNNFSQIDLVVVTKVGIIVFEVKDYSGWIFGNGQQTQWTKVLAYGRDKYRFYNPIMQNNKHIEDLKKQLRQFKNIPFYSIVVFYGDCILRDISFVPSGTFLVKSTRILEVVNNIMSENELAQYTDKHKIVRALKEAVQNGENLETQNQHIENIKDMLGKHRIFD